MPHNTEYPGRPAPAPAIRTGPFPAFGRTRRLFRMCTAMRFRVVLRARPTRLLSVLAVYCTPLVFAQTPLGRGVDGLVRLQNTDLAVFEAGDARKDLPCAVTPVKPVLGFDLRFHTGYDVSVPLRELAGGENILTVLFRVAPANRPEEYVY